MNVVAAMEAADPATHQVFVSYSRQDSDWAGAFADTLRKRGWSVFLDTHTIRPGEEWSPEIDAAIDAAKVVIALWSARSVSSSFVMVEAARAVVRNTLIPLSIDRTPPPPAFRRFQTQPMHVLGAATLPPELVSAIETRLLAAKPPAPSNANELRLQDLFALSATMAREHGVPLLALNALLERLGDIDIAAEVVPARLESFVGEFLKLKADLARPTNADANVATSQNRALDLMSAGNLNGARAVMDESLARQRESLAEQRESHRQSAREVARLLADRARIDMMQVRFPDAIAGYEEAADLVGFDAEAVVVYLESLVGVLLRQGDEFGDNSALIRAIDVIRKRALPLVSRERHSKPWAQLQSLLGDALRALGARDSSADRLLEAVTTYQVALEVCTRDGEPLLWADIQEKLGTALQALGERESDTAHLDGAVTAFRAALQILVPDRFPLEWATAQNNLGNTLHILGQREPGTLRLKEAEAAFRAALTELRRDRAPLTWAMTLGNLGSVLTQLGSRESEVTILEEAVAALTAASAELTRNRVPVLWAMTQSNLGMAVAMRGHLEGETQRLEEALTIFRATLEELTRQRAPLDWAKAQYNIGRVLLSLGQRESGTGRLLEAAEALQASLEEGTRDRVPLRWAQTRDILDQTLALIAERTSKR